MNVSPSYYSKSNDVQRRDSKYFYENYSHLIEWRRDGNDTVLDIGSGTGDVTNDFLLPILPNDFKYLVGADIAKNMVDFANEAYSSPKVSFIEWNMVGDAADLLRKFPEGFDHIFSIYAFHWERDHQRIFRNIYDLLTPNGDCLLNIMVRHNMFDIYLKLSKMPKWEKYFEKDIYVAQIYQYRNDREDMVRSYLRNAGFKKYCLEALSTKYIYENIEETKKFILAINPFLKYLTPAQKDDFFKDTFDIILKSGMGERTEDGEDFRFITTYDLLVVYARKKWCKSVM